MDINFDRPHRFVNIRWEGLKGPVSGELAYWCVGEGPDLVFIHGWPLRAATFRNLVPLLSRHFRCHLFDLPGSGLSPCENARPLAIANFHGALDAALTELQLDRHYLLAQDSGGQVARHLAALRPDKTLGLILGNTEIPGHHPWQMGMFGALLRAPGGVGIFKAILGSPLFSRMNLALGALFTDSNYANGGFRQHILTPLLERPNWFKRQLGLLSTYDIHTVDELPGIHAQLTMPTLLIWGDKDPWFPMTKAKKMMPQFAGPVAMEVLKGGKLFVHEDRAEEFAQLTLRFAQQDKPRLVA